MEAISKFRILSGSSDPKLLETIWELAQSRVLDLTNRKNYTVELESITLDIAIIMFNRMGTEGESSRNEGGISTSFDDLPLGLQRRIESKRIARVGGHAFEKEIIEEVPTSEEKSDKE